MPDPRHSPLVKLTHQCVHNLVYCRCQDLIKAVVVEGKWAQIEHSNVRTPGRWLSIAGGCVARNICACALPFVGASACERERQRQKERKKKSREDMLES